MNRRKFISLAWKTAFAVTAAGLVPLAAAQACHIVRRQIHLAGLPGVFDGFRVALLSDLHHGPWIDRAHLRRVVDLANSERPDLIALTGDYINHGRDWVPGCMAELSCLRARQGVVAVLGNHDHGDRAAAVVRQGLRQAGIADLTNTNITLERDGHSFIVGGVGDFWREKQDLHSALQGARHRESTLLLSHNPDYVETITDDRVGLVLSGHTHGGQCVFPLIGAPIVPSRYGQKYVSGLCQGPQARVFVTRGIGVISPPVRFCCPAEVALLTLRRT